MRLRFCPKTYTIAAACTDVTYGKYCQIRSHDLPSSRLA
jgi:hypothetical protein